MTPSATSSTPATRSLPADDGVCHLMHLLLQRCYRLRDAPRTFRARFGELADLPRQPRRNHHLLRRRACRFNGAAFNASNSVCAASCPVSDTNSCTAAAAPVQRRSTDAVVRSTTSCKFEQGRRRSAKMALMRRRGASNRVGHADHALPRPRAPRRRGTQVAQERVAFAHRRSLAFGAGRHLADGARHLARAVGELSGARRKLRRIFGERCRYIGHAAHDAAQSFAHLLHGRREQGRAPSASVRRRSGRSRSPAPTRAFGGAHQPPQWLHHRAHGHHGRSIRPRQ